MLASLPFCINGNEAVVYAPFSTLSDHREECVRGAVC